MEYMPSPESFTPDFLKPTLNPSPHSLYMYDQDHHHNHHDTSSPLFTPVCASAQELTQLPLAREAEFDPLHPQYENSNNLEGYFGGVLGASMAAATASTVSTPAVPFKPDLNLKQEEFATISQEDFDKIRPELTGVTEMSVMDPYRFDGDGVDGLALCQGGRLQPASTVPLHQKMEVVDPERDPSGHLHPSDLGPKTFTPLRTVRSTQSPTAIVRMLHHPSPHPSPCHTSTPSLTTLLTTSTNTTSSSSSATTTRRTPINIGTAVTAAAVSPPLPTTTPSSVIKTEPADREDMDSSNPCLHKIPFSHHQSHVRSPPSSTATHPTPSPSSSSSAGQSRAPSLGRQGKSGSVEEKWREIEKFIHDPSSDKPQTSASSSAAPDRKRKRHASSGSTHTVMSDDEESGMSQRIGSFTDDDSDSDDDSDISDTPFEESLTELAKRSKQYFWQYNIQAKGPKGTRLNLSVNDDDPHHPSRFEDPVFDPTNTNLVGIRHAGKARKGDGNEINPNPRKLYMIGQKLCRLNREINSVQLTGNLSASERSKSRKEKNKLSSRACRLKKKAQHEANKIKLFGLNCEQGELLDVVRMIWPKLRDQAKQQMKENIPITSNTPLTLQVNSFIKSTYKTKTAGNTANYVNQVIAQVEDGHPTGGLNIKLKPVKVK